MCVCAKKKRAMKKRGMMIHPGRDMGKTKRHLRWPGPFTYQCIPALLHCSLLTHTNAGVFGLAGDLSYGSLLRQAPNSRTHLYTGWKYEVPTDMNDDLVLK